MRVKLAFSLGRVRFNDDTPFTAAIGEGHTKAGDHVASNGADNGERETERREAERDNEEDDFGRRRSESRRCLLPELRSDDFAI